MPRAACCTPGTAAHASKRGANADVPARLSHPVHAPWRAAFRARQPALTARPPFLPLRSARMVVRADGGFIGSSTNLVSVSPRR